MVVVVVAWPQVAAIVGLPRKAVVFSIGRSLLSICAREDNSILLNIDSAPGDASTGYDSGSCLSIGQWPTGVEKKSPTPTTPISAPVSCVG